MQRIYVAGCGGMLGDAFYRQLRGEHRLRCTDIDLNADWLSYCDFRDYESYRRDVEGFRPEILFHLGAHTDLEYCENNPDDAFATNTLAVEHAVAIANDLRIPILYIGTAGIFDGAKPVYDEWDQPNPLGIYARSKYAAERHVVERTRRHLVCRAGWMMGGGPDKDKKFVQKMMRQLAQGRTRLQVVNDKLGTPTYTHDFVKNVRLLLRHGAWGLYNLVCEGETSRLEVVGEMLRILGLQDSVEVQPVTSAFFKREYFAERPDCECLVNRKLNLLELNVMRDWKTALVEYLDDAYDGYLDRRGAATEREPALVRG